VPSTSHSLEPSRFSNYDFFFFSQAILTNISCYVRARRLNVIIQPHLRFMYELLKFEEKISFKNRSTPKRELEWTHIAREIATMNRPYTRQN